MRAELGHSHNNNDDDDDGDDDDGNGEEPASQLASLLGRERQLVRQKGREGKGPLLGLCQVLSPA